MMCAGGKRDNRGNNTIRNNYGNNAIEIKKKSDKIILAWSACK